MSELLGYIAEAEVADQLSAAARRALAAVAALALDPRAEGTLASIAETAESAAQRISHGKLVVHNEVARR
jgi:hypothetical protein